MQTGERKPGIVVFVFLFSESYNDAHPFHYFFFIYDEFLQFVLVVDAHAMTSPQLTGKTMPRRLSY